MHEMRQSILIPKQDRDYFFQKLKETLDKVAEDKNAEIIELLLDIRELLKVLESQGRGSQVD